MLLSFSAHTCGRPYAARGAGDSKEISLSVEESNALRAKLGLKPLKIDDPNADKAGDDEAPAPGMCVPLHVLSLPPPPTHRATSAVIFISNRS